MKSWASWTADRIFLQLQRLRVAARWQCSTKLERQQWIVTVDEQVSRDHAQQIAHTCAHAQLQTQQHLAASHCAAGTNKHSHEVCVVGASSLHNTALSLLMFRVLARRHRIYAMAVFAEWKACSGWQPGVCEQSTVQCWLGHLYKLRAWVMV